jgi:hypothetical protein
MEYLYREQYGDNTIKTRFANKIPKNQKKIYKERVSTLTPQ